MSNDKNTLVVNLFAGPGTGKSTTASGIFYELKSFGVSCEIASEFAKDLVYEDRHSTFKDQIYIFGKQYHRINRLLGKVDVVICDSPLLLTPIYDEKKRVRLAQLAIEEHREMNTYNVFLTRVKAYKTHGRNQTEDEAVEIDNKIKHYLKEICVPLEFVKGDRTAKDTIVESIFKKIKVVTVDIDL